MKIVAILAVLAIALVVMLPWLPWSGQRTPDEGPVRFNFLVGMILFVLAGLVLFAILMRSR